MRTYDTLRRDERVTLALRALYERGGYRRFRMDRFEEYDFYAVNREFLADSRILSFTDLDGRLLALRPDVTLSIVKQTEAEPDGAQRLYYTESVFRPARGAASYRETFQVGVEYIGRVTPYASVEMVTLAAGSLACVGGDYALDVSHTRFLEGALQQNTMLGAVLSSQIISNVPAAVLLSNFTTDAKGMLLGTNIGGLGTLVASLASLISFKQYIRTPGAKPLRYLGLFTAANVVMLVVLYIFAAICL